MPPNRPKARRKSRTAVQLQAGGRRAADLVEDSRKGQRAAPWPDFGAEKAGDNEINVRTVYCVNTSA